MPENSEVSEALKKKTPDQLAEWQAQFRIHSDTDILAEREWERRARVEQHKSLRINIILSSSIAVAAAILGAIVGAVSTALLR